MANYIVLFRFTDQGMRNIKESPARIEAAKQSFRKAGAEVKEFYALLGRYDTMVVVQAPGDENVAKACLSIGALGNVHTETLRAFTESEFQKLIGALP